MPSSAWRGEASGVGAREAARQAERLSLGFPITTHPDLVVTPATRVSSRCSQEVTCRSGELCFHFESLPVPCKQ